MGGGGPAPWPKRREELDRLCAGEQLDRERPLGVVEHAQRLEASAFPIDTWSSWPALVGIESTLAGCASTLFSETSDAATYCGIMNPELSPPSSTRNGGKPSNTMS